jgi:hypothetical protein
MSWSRLIGRYERVQTKGFSARKDSCLGRDRRPSRPDRWPGR